MILFLFVIRGSTHGKAPAGFAPLAIGLCLTLIHLVSIGARFNPLKANRKRKGALKLPDWFNFPVSFWIPLDTVGNKKDGTPPFLPR